MCSYLLSLGVILPSFPKEVVLVFIMQCSYARLFCITWGNEPAYLKKKKGRKKPAQQCKYSFLWCNEMNKLFWQENPYIAGQDAALSSGEGQKQKLAEASEKGRRHRQTLACFFFPFACHHRNAVSAVRPPPLEEWKGGSRKEEGMSCAKTQSLSREELFLLPEIIFLSANAPPSPFS